MAMSSHLFLVYNNGKKLTESKNLEALWKSIGVSADGNNNGLNISEVSGTFHFNSKKLTGVAGGTASGEVLTYDQRGANNGVASLDGSGKVPVTQLPNSVMEFQGSWDASSNTPELADGTGNAGDTYRVSVSGTQTFGGIEHTYNVGDFIIYSGSVWQFSPAADGVTSVNGQAGVVTLTTDDVNEGATNKYYTATQARADVVTNAINELDGDIAPSGSAVFSALATKSDTTHDHTGVYATVSDLGDKADLIHSHLATDITDFDTAAKTAVVIGDIIPGMTDSAPSVDVLYKTTSVVGAGFPLVVGGTQPTITSNSQLFDTFNHFKSAFKFTLSTGAFAAGIMFKFQTFTGTYNARFKLKIYTYAVGTDPESQSHIQDSLNSVSGEQFGSTASGALFEFYTNNYLAAGDYWAVFETVGSAATQGQLAIATTTGGESQYYNGSVWASGSGPQLAWFELGERNGISTGLSTLGTTGIVKDGFTVQESLKRLNNYLSSLSISAGSVMYGGDNFSGLYAASGTTESAIDSLANYIPDLQAADGVSSKAIGSYASGNVFSRSGTSGSGFFILSSSSTKWAVLLPMKTGVIRTATISLKYQSGVPAGLITAKIYSFSSINSPVLGTLLGTSSNTIDAASITSSYANYTWNFSDIASKSGDNYYLVLESSAPNSNAVVVDTVGSAGSGTKTYNYFGGSWGTSNQSDIRMTLSGDVVSENMGTFSGDIIPDNLTIKEALQVVETALSNTAKTFDVLLAEDVSAGDLLFISNDSAAYQLGTEIANISFVGHGSVICIATVSGTATQTIKAYAPNSGTVITVNPSLTFNSLLYASSTPGAYTQTMPTTGKVIVIGKPISTTQYLFEGYLDFEYA